MRRRLRDWMPFAGVPPRLAWLRGTLLVACFLGLSASAPLWLNKREFPLVPIADWFPILPAPGDKFLFGSLLLALVLAGWRYRIAVGYFLAGTLFAFFQDQNRGQPWLYMYWVFLLLTLLPPPNALAAGRWAVIVVYLWSGIQKCNARFFERVPSWFVSPAEQWHLSVAILDLLRWTVAATPFLEIAIGLALCSVRGRRPAIGAVVALHLGAVLFLGPLGHNYNWVVWPWNLAMIALVGILFLPTFPIYGLGSELRRQSNCSSTEGVGCRALPVAFNLRHDFARLRHSSLALVLLLLFSLLPGLSYLGWWDSNFSFALYSENKASANIFVTPAFAERLPTNLRRYVLPFPAAPDPRHQSSFYFAFDAWGYETLHVPPLSEPRSFRAIFLRLKTYARNVDELRMIVGARDGSVRFYEGEAVSALESR